MSETSGAPVIQVPDVQDLESLNIVIMNPQKTVWKGKAKSITSDNERGTFDILPMHANFVTLLEKRTIHINLGTEKQDYTFDHAVMYCHKNIVFIFSDL